MGDYSVITVANSILSEVTNLRRSAATHEGVRLLDLFCGAGLAAWGYWRSGRFSEIVGVDHEDMSGVYAFDFIQADAYTLDYDFLMGFDFIHASPPCQWYSQVTPAWAKENHKRSIPPVLHMLHAAGVPYCVENVPGAALDLRPNWWATGRDVGLPHARKRLFRLSWVDEMSTWYSSHEMNISSGTHINSAIAANVSAGPVAQISIDDVPNVRVHDSSATKADLIGAMGLSDMPKRWQDRVTVSHIQQGIPPAMTARIAEMWSATKFMIR